MAQVLSGFCFTCIMSAVMASCSEKEVPRFCQNYDLVPQNYCTGVHLDPIWRCKPGSNGRCACPPDLHRAANRKCVKKEQCQEFGNKQQPKREQSATVELPLVVPESLQANPEDERKVRELIQESKELHLFEISDKEWSKSECTCLDSVLIEKTQFGAKRKIGCYVYGRSILLRHGQQVGPTQMRVMKSFAKHMTAQFDVKQDPWLYVILTSTGDDIPQRTSVEIHERLQGAYNVLAYDDDCVLLGFGSFHNAQFDCMVLVSLDSNGGYEKSGKKCFNDTSICRGEMLNVWTDDCKNAYNEDKRREMKASEKKASGQGA